MIEHNRLNFIEGLGNNCELGFVLRKMGHERGFYFRSVAARTASVSQIIEQDFDGAYQFDNLLPHPGDMVMDTAFGAAYHGRMPSRDVSGELSFSDDDAARRATHAQDCGKIKHLVSRFRQNLSCSGMVYVVKDPSAKPSQIDNLFKLISERRTNPNFTFLEMHELPVRAGEVDIVSPNRAVGYLSFIAPFNKTDQGDQESWVSVLDRVVPKIDAP